ncbi:hypothetical protein G6F24_017268 [Rhizopus arrhizus]|nr:hypothetical protein G6F24_017268 [Rhizopus arrhizus]
MAAAGWGAGEGSAAWSWQAPCRQAEATTDKGGGQGVARKPVCDERRRAQGPHAPPAIAGRRIASRHRFRTVPAGKRK